VTYRQEISFPINPTKEDLKKLKREVARDKFEVLDSKEKAKRKDKKVKR